MFTGLIETVGVITSIERAGKGINMSVKPLSDFEVQIGDSISINGVCLTATKKGNDIVFNVSPETIKSTNLGDIRVNNKVNLERAMRLTDRLGGHIVTGHVDGIGTATNKRQEGDYTFYTFETSPEILRYMVKKGSVAVDGISLTVIWLDSKSFSVAIIPHTLSATNIKDKNIGDRVNIEVDIIGKYVEKFMSREVGDSSLMKLLKEKGFAE